MSERVDWERLDTLLDEAIEVPPADRARWLDERCGDQPALRARLQQLLRLVDEGDGPLMPGGATSALRELGLEARAVAPPALEPGTRLGRYEVRGLLGTGGMGRVYRALDPVLGREVAIKALADEIQGDSAGFRRLEREARALANLNHPNVATIYGFEVLDGTPYLVLELVEGESLHERLSRGRLRLREAIDVARQVAAGLEEAHRKGVVHRDLKPSNVMLGADRRVMLLDFGIAKAVARDGEGPDGTYTRTAPGAVLGTAPYMSPEQIRGDEVDAGTDIWAFGCLFYEMLSGRRAFRGGSSPEVLAAVLRDEVDWTALPSATPPAARRLAERCLRRDRHQRLQDIGDARLELEELEVEATAPTAPVTARSSASRSWLPWALALVAAGALAGGAFVALRPAPAPPTVRLSLDFPPGFSLADDFAAPFAIAPDGSRLALLGSRAPDQPLRLYLRDVGALQLVELAGTEGARMPFFSPDGRAVGFFADRKLKKISLDSGAVVAIADIGGNFRGASWAPDGSIVLAPSHATGLSRVREGAALEPLTTLEGAEESHRWPHVLPDGKWALFSVEAEADAPYDEAWIDAVSLATGERRHVMRGGAHGHVLPTGQLVFIRGGSLYAVDFDAERMTVRGEPEAVLEGVEYDPRNGGAHLAIAASGTLLYGPGVPPSLERYLAWVDAEGRVTRLVDTPRIFREPRLARDGRRVAMGVGATATAQLWFLETGSGTLSPSGIPGVPHQPAWRPDGEAVTVGVARGARWQLLTVPADGGGNPVTVLESPHRIHPCDWAPDGRTLVYQERRKDTGWDLQMVTVDASGRAVGAPRPLAASRFSEANAVVSADGRWVAYESDEIDNVVEIYVRAFPSGEGKVRASNTGARWPRWGKGTELFYWFSFVGGLQRVDGRVDGGRFNVAQNTPVWPAEGGKMPERLVVRPGFESFDVDVERGRFLMLETSVPSLEPELRQPVVVLNWSSDLRARKR